MKKVAGNSLLPQQDLIQKLTQDFPEITTEGKIDIEKLKAVLGVEVDLGEKYGISWKGKSSVFKTIQESTTKTLKPQPEESINFDTSENLFIEGDNLEVLKTLQRAYYGKVKMIYIDPPYNTGNDFVYNDSFAQNKKDYEQEAGIRDGDGNVNEMDSFSRNTKDSGHFHSNWLNMMYPRLYLARNLLRQDGVIFVSIDDNEVHNLRMIMNEIFGEENFVAEIIWEKRFTRSNNAKLFANLTEKILLYRKSEIVETLRDDRNEKSDSIYSNPDNDPRGEWTSVSYVNPATKNQRPNLAYPILNPFTKEEVIHPTNAWKYSKSVYENHLKENRLYWGSEEKNKYPRLKRFLSELNGGIVPVDLWRYQDVGTTDQASKELENLMSGKFFDFPKPVLLIQRMLSISTDPESEDIILDFFAGSGTTAHAVMQQNAKDGGNRKWICVQLPEETDEQSEANKTGYKSISEISKDRIRRAAQKIQKEFNEKQPSLIDSSKKVLDLGFKSFKLANSNFKIWDGSVKDPEKLEQQMIDFLDMVKKNANEEDILFELLLKSGISPTVKNELKNFETNKYWIIPDYKTALYLGSNLTEELFNEMLKESPNKLILLDRAFENNDVLKTNIHLQADNKNIEVVCI